MKIKIKKVEKPIVEKGIGHFKFFDWDSLWVYHPCVVEHNKEFYLIYTGKSIKRGVSHKIGIAASKDLNSWQKFDSNPLLNEGKDGEWDNDFVAHAYVFKDKDKFYMLYDGSKRGNWLESIGIAESKNLTDWKKYSGNPIFTVGTNWWEKRHVSRCCVFKENGLYYLYYAGHDGERERIGMAKDKSLFGLKRSSDRPVLNIGKEGEWDEESISDPRIIKYNKEYLMFYSGIDRKGIERMGLAISKDLFSWKKYKKNPILDVSASSWDKISAARADIKIFHNRFYIFYSGRKNFFYSIGIADLEVKK